MFVYTKCVQLCVTYVCNKCLYLKYGKVRGMEGGYGLPRKGYRTICVTDEVYHCIQTKAKETKRTIPEYIKYLMEKEGTQKGAKPC